MCTLKKNIFPTFIIFCATLFSDPILRFIFFMIIILTLLFFSLPLIKALIVEEPSSEPRESHPANLVSLRTQAASLRDQIHRIEKEEEVKGTLNNRRSSSGSGNAPGSVANLKATEKPRKKLAEVEAQLVLASPSLVFQVSYCKV